ncbi:hypothetical protein FLM9_272 [Candidatus Synechococcus spongiarum]|uniref:Uncharacterized protein n=1 Tax=Candidatus Synechococcus spongiarum TaxID=431041 RepID=A0A171DF36_9SYNE|nr:hypothetical protein FLM9_272 [Candidatus Synechococcus spongiarum]
MGTAISPAKLICDAVVQSLSKLLRSHQVRDDCRRVASWFESVDSISQTCHLIEALPGELRQSR